MVLLQYDDICEVFTDKLVAKIPSTHDGVIKSIKYKNDEMCLVGHALIEIEVDEGNEATPTTAQSAKKAEESSSSSSSDEGQRIGRTKLDAKIE